VRKGAVAREGYKKTELGWIPEDWEPLGSVFDIFAGGDVPKEAFSEIETEEFKVPILSNGIGGKSLYGWTDKAKINKPSLTVSARGTIGWTSYREQPFVPIVRLLVLTPKTEINLKYAYYFMKTIENNYKVSLAGIPQLTKPMIQNVKIPLPPLAEQKKIAEILSTWDEAVEKLNSYIEAKKKLKKALMQRLLTGKQRIKESIVREGYKKTELGWIPEDWEVKRLGEVADRDQRYSFTGGPFGSDLKSEDYTETGVRIIQLQNIGDGEFLNHYSIFTSEEKANHLHSCNIYPGDIILAKMDPVARSCIIPNIHERFVMCSDGIRLSVDRKLFNRHFIFYFINLREFRCLAESKATGGTRKRIGLDVLRNLPIAFPPLPEQKKIAEILSKADEEIDLLNQELEKLKTQKKGLMQKLLTGVWRVKL
jgi:type I restriction enzyme S subunit